MKSTWKAVAAALLLSAAVFAGAVQLNSNASLSQGGAAGIASPSGNGYFVDIEWQNPHGNWSGSWNATTERYEDDGGNWVQFDDSDTPHTFSSNMGGRETGTWQ